MKKVLNSRNNKVDIYSTANNIGHCIYNLQILIPYEI